jgi:hypothetical protein
MPPSPSAPWQGRQFVAKIALPAPIASGLPCRLGPGLPPAGACAPPGAVGCGAVMAAAREAWAASISCAYSSLEVGPKPK